MKFAIFIAPKDFKDETVSMLKTMFDKWGIEYSIASYANKDCVGYHGAVYKPDMNAAKISPNDFDGILLVDGKGFEDYRLFEYRPLLDTLIIFNERGKYIGAINNSIKAVARANIIKNKKVAMPQDEEMRRLILLFHGIPSEENIEISGNLVTIKNSTALEVPLRTLLQSLGVI
jgi:putative intracellular protease/amidase